MALIEKYHVVAAVRPVEALQTIKEGQVVSLNTSGNVVIQGSSNPIPYGIAGDTKNTSASSMPGVAAGWQNRVSDYFDETKASGKMTVYHSGGEFATDQFASNVHSLTPLTALYAYDGYLDTNNAQSAVVVAYLTQAHGAYPSGVPGVDINGDQALAGEDWSGTDPRDNTYIEFKLMI
jgi:hypothetical protein